MFGEHTRAIEQVESNGTNDVVCWHWWTSGNYGDTICTTFFPINPTKKLPYMDTDGATGTPPAVLAVSSMHPGGANVAFCDGSVRFVKETISCWNLSQTAPATPPGMTLATAPDPSISGYTAYYWVPNTTVQMGVWQQLGTRNGGELVSSDQY